VRCWPSEKGEGLEEGAYKGEGWKEVQIEECWSSKKYAKLVTSLALAENFAKRQQIVSYFSFCTKL
jgi:hypothetical protein